MGLKYEVYSTNNDSKPRSTIEWDGKKIVCSSRVDEQMLKERSIAGKSWEDGEEFLRVLPMLYRNGYTYLKRVDEDG